MKLYVAGPMRGIPEFNFPAFDQATAHLRELGHEVCNPAEHDRATHGEDFGAANIHGDEALEVEFDLGEALAFDLSFVVKEADAVAVLDGWEKSRGARAEVAAARAKGIPVAPVHEFTHDGIESPLTEWELDYMPVSAPPCITLGVGPLDDDEALVAAFTAALDKPVQLWQREPIAQRREEEAKHLDAIVNITSIVDPTINAADYQWTGISTYGGPPQEINVTTGEVRSVSSSGGEKGVKPARFDLIPEGPLWTVAELYGFGARKYADHNWRKGYEWSKSYAALRRHASQFWQGQDIDDESQLPHLASVVFHALALMEYATTHPEFDDRYKGEPA